jgi:hypothetical protein
MATTGGGGGDKSSKHDKSKRDLEGMGSHHSQIEEISQMDASSRQLGEDETGDDHQEKSTNPMMDIEEGDPKHESKRKSISLVRKSKEGANILLNTTGTFQESDSV